MPSAVRRTSPSPMRRRPRPCCRSRGPASAVNPPCCCRPTAVRCPPSSRWSRPMGLPGRHQARRDGGCASRTHGSPCRSRSSGRSMRTASSPVAPGSTTTAPRRSPCCGSPRSHCRCRRGRRPSHATPAAGPQRCRRSAPRSRMASKERCPSKAGRVTRAAIGSSSKSPRPTRPTDSPSAHISPGAATTRCSWNAMPTAPAC